MGTRGQLSQSGSVKWLLTVGLLTIMAFSVSAQVESEYYRPATERVRMERVMARYGELYTRERWYVGAEGFIKSDNGRLNQTFNGLIRTEPTARASWSATVGWIRRERWAIEAGYARGSLHNTLLAGNATNPLRLQFENGNHNLILRGKRLLRFGKQAARRSGLWVGAGVWAMPNGKPDLTRFVVAGYSYYAGPLDTRVDTIRINGENMTNTGMKALAELSMEYAVRLGGRMELSLFARKYWGLRNAMTTNMTYLVNGSEQQRAVLTNNGNGWGLGVTLRYVYALRYDLRKMPGLFNIKGNYPKPKDNRSRSRTVLQDGE